MDTPQAPSLDAIAAAVVAHLESRPLAIDSAAGVARWWIGDAGRHVRIERVEAALALLVERAVLRRVPLADGTVLYAQALTRQ